MDMSQEDFNRLVRAIRFISHGEEDPAGLELLAMAFSQKGEASISSALSLMSDDIQDVVMGLNRIAAALEKRNGH